MTPCELIRQTAALFHSAGIPDPAWDSALLLAHLTGQPPLNLRLDTDTQLSEDILRAFAELKEFCGFEYYGRKHLENILTAFIQLVWFPQKFGVDKRKSHLSSMIVSGQMTREEALKEMEEPLYDQAQMDEYIRIIKEKLNISDEEFAEMMQVQPHQHTEYKVESQSLYYQTVMAAFHIFDKARHFWKVRKSNYERKSAE